MNEAEFNEEISRLKIVRRADHYKPRLNQSRPQVKTIKPAATRAPAKAVAERSAPVTVDMTQKESLSPMKFWDVLKVLSSNTIGSRSDVEKFMIAVKQVSHHPVIILLPFSVFVQYC